MAEDIFNKVFTYSFSDEQVKKILVDLLILSGEVIPVDVHDNLDPAAFCQFDSPITVGAETGHEITESFSLKLSFTDVDLKDFHLNYNQELEARKENGETASEPIPDNVWTQETALSCGKE